MNFEITQKHQELFDQYQSEFCNYGRFAVKLVVDNELQDNYGEEFSPVCIKVLDEYASTEFQVLIDTEYRCYYAFCDCDPEELDYASDLWKFMYLS